MSFGTSNHIPSPGLHVRTVINGVEQKTQSQPLEEAMPRGVYERKPRAPKTDLGGGSEAARPAKAKKHKRGPGRIPVARADYSAVIAALRAKREAIDAAIRAIESL